jgi:hypothetical protein
MLRENQYLILILIPVQFKALNALNRMKENRRLMRVTLTKIYSKVRR